MKGKQVLFNQHKKNSSLPPIYCSENNCLPSKISLNQINYQQNILFSVLDHKVHLKCIFTYTNSILMFPNIIPESQSPFPLNLLDQSCFFQKQPFLLPYKSIKPCSLWLLGIIRNSYLHPRVEIICVPAFRVMWKEQAIKSDQSRCAL